MGRLEDIHRVPGRLPLAWFLTMRTYGTFLHGDVRGAVDRDHRRVGMPRVAADTVRVASERGRMRHGAVEFGAEAARVLEETVREVCAHRGWTLLAVAVRSTHVHVVVFARVSAERVMGDLKAWGTRRLREAGVIGAGRTVWAQHGSMPGVWSEEELAEVVSYVMERQGPPLAGG